MPNDSAPPADSHGIILAADRAGKEDDPVSRLFTEPPGPARGLQVRHWIGVAILALTVGGAAFVLPPLISAKGPTAPSPTPSSPLPQPGGPLALPVPLPSGGPASSAGAPSKAATSAQAGPGATTARPATTSRTPTAKAATTPPTVTTTPTKAPAGTFKTLTVQAENATLGDGAQAMECETCGGGRRVRYLGRVEAQFSVPVSGERTITVAYTVGDNTYRQMTVTMNGTAVKTAWKVKGTVWDEPQTVSVTATVPAGTVTIAVAGDPNGPDLDAISIS